MIARLPWIFTLVSYLVFSGAAAAGDWALRSDADGTHRAEIGASRASLSLECGPQRKSIALELIGKPATATVSFFNPSRPDFSFATLDFKDGVYLSSSEAEQKAFDNFLHALNWMARLRMRLPDMTEVSVTLNGIRPFIAACKSVGDGSDLTKAEMAELQTNLKRLDRYRGRTDGLPSTDFSNAVASFNNGTKDFRLALQNSRKLLQDPEFMRKLRFSKWRVAKLRYPNAVWTKQDYGKGDATISVKSAGTFSFTCRYADGTSKAKNSIQLKMPGSLPLAPITVQVDEGDPLHFAMATMEIDTEAEAKQFNRLLDEVSDGQKLKMTNFRNETLSITLQGSADVLGPCRTPLYPYQLRSDEEEEALREKEQQPVLLEVNQNSLHPGVQLCNKGHTSIKIASIVGGYDTKKKRLFVEQGESSTLHILEANSCAYASRPRGIVGFVFERLSEDNDTWYEPNFTLRKTEEQLAVEFEKVCVTQFLIMGAGEGRTYLGAQKMQDIPTSLQCGPDHIHRDVDVNVMNDGRHQSINIY